MRPSVVVLGSGTPGRECVPPLTCDSIIATASHEIGRELAAAGCDLVFFSDDSYLEADAVKEYLSAERTAGRVVVHAPHDNTVSFDVTAEAPQGFRSNRIRPPNGRLPTTGLYSRPTPSW